MKIVLGDIVEMAFDGQLDVIVQGCNCFCRMENGLAKTIADRCPNAVSIDNTTKAGDRNKLGTYTVGFQTGTSGHQFAIVNAYIQYERRREEGEDLVEYEALCSIMRAIGIEFKDMRIGIPLIGAGIACGDWARIERIILQELFECDVTIVHLEHDFKALFAKLAEKTLVSSNGSDVLKHLEGEHLRKAGGATLRYMFQNDVPLTAHTMTLLYAITNKNPVLHKDAGNIYKMALAWRSWAKENGYD